MPIPMLLAVSTVHHHLINKRSAVVRVDRCQLRGRAGCSPDFLPDRLRGDAVHPYLALQTLILPAR